MISVLSLITTFTNIHPDMHKLEAQTITLITIIIIRSELQKSPIILQCRWKLFGLCQMLPA